MEVMVTEMGKRSWRILGLGPLEWSWFQSLWATGQGMRSVVPVGGEGSVAAKCSMVLKSKDEQGKKTKTEGATGGARRGRSAGGTTDPVLGVGHPPSQDVAYSATADSAESGSDDTALHTRSQASVSGASSTVSESDNGAHGADSDSGDPGNPGKSAGLSGLGLSETLDGAGATEKDRPGHTEALAAEGKREAAQALSVEGRTPHINYLIF